MCKQERCHLGVLRDSIICNKTAFSQFHSLLLRGLSLCVAFFVRYSYREDLCSSIVPRTVHIDINTWFEGTPTERRGVRVCVHTCVWVCVWERQGRGGGMQTWIKRKGRWLFISFWKSLLQQQIFPVFYQDCSAWPTLRWWRWNRVQEKCKPEGHLIPRPQDVLLSPSVLTDVQYLAMSF